MHIEDLVFCSEGYSPTPSLIVAVVLNLWTEIYSAPILHFSLFHIRITTFLI